MQITQYVLHPSFASPSSRISTSVHSKELAVASDALECLLRFPDIDPPWNHVVAVSCVVPPDSLLCSICLESFLMPRLTPCRHLFCLVCIWEYFCSRPGATAPCPLCSLEGLNFDSLVVAELHVVHPRLAALPFGTLRAFESDLPRTVDEDLPELPDVGAEEQTGPLILHFVPHCRAYGYLPCGTKYPPSDLAFEGDSASRFRNRYVWMCPKRRVHVLRDERSILSDIMAAHRGTHLDALLNHFDLRIAAVQAWESSDECAPPHGDERIVSPSADRDTPNENVKMHTWYASSEQPLVFLHPSICVLEKSKPSAESSVLGNTGIFITVDRAARLTQTATMRRLLPSLAHLPIGVGFYLVGGTPFRDGASEESTVLVSRDPRYLTVKEEKEEEFPFSPIDVPHELLAIGDGVKRNNSNGKYKTGSGMSSTGAPLVGRSPWLDAITGPRHSQTPPQRMQSNIAHPWTLGNLDHHHHRTAVRSAHLRLDHGGNTHDDDDTEDTFTENPIALEGVRAEERYEALAAALRTAGAAAPPNDHPTSKRGARKGGGVSISLTTMQR